MKSKTSLRHYYSDIQFIGRDIRANVRQVKFDQSIDGISGTGWIASVDDKPLSNMSRLQVYSQCIREKDCTKALKQILQGLTVEKCAMNLKIILA